MISNKVKTINKVFYTHKHADQTHGINDLRPFFLINKKQIPVYADQKLQNIYIQLLNIVLNNQNFIHQL